MTLGVDVSLVRTRAALGRERIAEIARAVLRAERVREAMLSITLVTDTEIARLNRRHLGHRGPTDVISFALQAGGGPVVGDVYIAPAVVRENARRHGRPAREELLRVVVHGTLHVLGHEHPDDETRMASAMWRRQEQLVRRLLAPARA